MKVTPNSFRRTFASLAYALGNDPIYVAEQGGWSDPAFPMQVYAKAITRRGKLSGRHLAECERALNWSDTGRNAVQVPMPTDLPTRQDSLGA